MWRDVEKDVKMLNQVLTDVDSRFTSGDGVSTHQWEKSLCNKKGLDFSRPLSLTFKLLIDPNFLSMRN